MPCRKNLIIALIIEDYLTGYCFTVGSMVKYQGTRLKVFYSPGKMVCFLYENLPTSQGITHYVCVIKEKWSIIE